ncbi:MAG: complex I NDUFA9 subunit family protein [Gammaproteobacteria bacterium]|nr:complex I NDUFA9 subunit family protein [Gammaproteobacteria bacterium]
MAQHHIAILGGSGFVGQRLSTTLLAQGQRVRVVSRGARAYPWLSQQPELELVECQMEEGEALRQALAGCDVVINLVGILNERGHHGEGFRRAHVGLAQGVIAACRANTIQRVLHMSALGASLDEGASLYQQSKAEAEELMHSCDDLQVTSFRPSVIFGPGDSFLNRFARLLRLTPFLFPLACAQSRFAPVYVGDVAECFARAIDNPLTYHQHYELCGPQSYTLQQLVEYTARELGLRRRVVPLPDWAARLQANLLEWVPGKPFSRDNYRSLQRDNVCHGEFPALFGITPRRIEEVVPSYLNATGRTAHR